MPWIVGPLRLGLSMPVFRSVSCWAPIRGGKRISRVQSRADLVHSRLVNWSEQKSVLWQGVLAPRKVVEIALQCWFFFFKRTQQFISKKTAKRRGKQAQQGQHGKGQRVRKKRAGS